MVRFRGNTSHEDVDQVNIVRTVFSNMVRVAVQFFMTLLTLPPHQGKWFAEAEQFPARFSISFMEEHKSRETITNKSRVVTAVSAPIS